MLRSRKFSDQIWLALSIAEADWCAALTFNDESWQPVSIWGSSLLNEVSMLLEMQEIQTWISGSSASGRMRSRLLKGSALGKEHARLNCYPAPNSKNALLVYSSQEIADQTDRSIFKILSTKISEEIPSKVEAPQVDPERKIQEAYLKLAGHLGSFDISELDVDAILYWSCERAREILNGYGAEIGILDNVSGKVHIRFSNIPGDQNRHSSVNTGQDITGKIIAEGQPLIVNNYAEWSERVLNAGIITAAVGVPIKYKDETFGAMIVVCNNRRRYFTRNDTDLLNLLATQVSISIRNARLLEELGRRIQMQKFSEEKMVEAARLAAIGELAAGIAHELNNPLTAITGFSEILLAEFPEASVQRENMQLVLSEAKRARQVVRGMLDFSRADRSVIRQINLTDLVSEAISLLQPMAQEQEIKIIFEALDKFPSVPGNAAQLRQVLLNLLTNSMHAIKGNGKIFIRMLLEQAETKNIKLVIKDTGEGIPPAYLEKIFDPFFTTKPAGVGTGLGLSITKKILSDHDGEIHIQSVEGRGTTVIIKLPVARKAAMRAADEG